jgi:hypothetical protein
MKKASSLFKVLFLLFVFASVSYGAPSFLSGMDATTTYADTTGKSWLGLVFNWFFLVILPAGMIFGFPMLVSKYLKKHITSGNEDEKWKLPFAYLGASALGIIVYLFALFFVSEGLLGGGDKGITLLQAFWRGVAGA